MVESKSRQYGLDVNPLLDLGVHTLFCKVLRVAFGKLLHPTVFLDVLDGARFFAPELLADDLVSDRQQG